MNKEIDGTEQVYDSRDIIARIESLEACELGADDASRLAELRNKETTDGELSDTEQAELESLEGQDTLTDDEKDELAELRKFASECEGYADWQHGETIIAREYFVEYIAELIDDCYEMPKQMNSGEWPWRHMTMDVSAAAKEAEQDYADVSMFGFDFLIRTC